jgi:hypothetical protein
MKNFISSFFCSWTTRGILAVAIAVLPSATSFADTSINYGTLVGTTVTYVNVTESSATDQVPLFGSPIISGNTLDFNPQGFAATSTGGGIDLTDGQLNLLIQAHSGYSIPMIQFSEAGDFSLAGFGTANTRVTVAATFFLDVLKVDGVSIDPVSIAAHMTFSPKLNGQFDLINDAGVGNIWTGVFDFNLNAALSSHGITFENGATEVRVNLDNTLLAISEAGSTAYIAKKDFKGLGITVVPEPSVIAMSLFGVAALVLRSRSVRRS